MAADAARRGPRSRGPVPRRCALQHRPDALAIAPARGSTSRGGGAAAFTGEAAVERAEGGARGRAAAALAVEGA